MRGIAPFGRNTAINSRTKLTNWRASSAHTHLEEPFGEVALERAAQQRVASAPDQVCEVRVAARQAAVLLRRASSHRAASQELPKGA